LGIILDISILSPRLFPKRKGSGKIKFPSIVNFRQVYHCTSCPRSVLENHVWIATFLLAAASLSRVFQLFQPLIFAPLVHSAHTSDHCLSLYGSSETANFSSFVIVETHSSNCASSREHSTSQFSALRAGSGCANKRSMLFRDGSPFVSNGGFVGSAHKSSCQTMKPRFFLSISLHEDVYRANWLLTASDTKVR